MLLDISELGIVQKNRKCTLLFDLALNLASLAVHLSTFKAPSLIRTIRVNGEFFIFGWEYFGIIVA
ncbi:hypothetical protein D3C84_906690 [compost metagenome]